MYGGKIQEIASIDEIFKNPLHPYTKALMQSIPKLDKKENRWMIAGRIKIEDLENVSKIADYVDASGSLEKNKKKDLDKIKKFLLKVKEINDQN